MKRAEQAADTRVALIDAAKRLFATRGYLNTKITDITAEAGRAAGSFYNHFASKEELLEALLADVAATGDALAGTEEHEADFSDPDAIRYHVAAFWRVYHAHAPTMLALSQAALVSGDFAGVVERFRRAQIDDLTSHLEHVHNLPATPEASLTMMGVLMDGLTRVWSDVPEDEAVEAITRFVYRALNGRDYPPPADTHQRDG
ncbi:TetR/AcrR family transcriptional regulator [Rugosimonospora acidiphila]|uniref:TetR/AcrR family transcriptional regulator n=1 Tax=Rugosimonospora acidiphila TaxID=556531 RepID=A0ABP9S5T7_9ACTN